MVSPSCSVFPLPCSRTPQGVTVEVITPGDGKTFPRRGGTCQPSPSIAFISHSLWRSRQGHDSLRWHAPRRQEVRLQSGSVRHRLCSCSLASRSRSHRSGQPFETEIGVGKVIKGWDEGTSVSNSIAPVQSRSIVRHRPVRCTTAVPGREGCPDGDTGFCACLLFFAPLLAHSIRPMY